MKETVSKTSEQNSDNTTPRASRRETKSFFTDTVCEMSRNLTYHLLNHGRKQWTRSFRGLRPPWPMTYADYVATACETGGKLGAVGGTLFMAQVWRKERFNTTEEKALVFLPILVAGAACGFVAGGTAPFWLPVYGLTRVADGFDKIVEAANPPAK